MFLAQTAHREIPDRVQDNFAARAGGSAARTAKCGGAESDQVICCAPAINSQIQSGMTGELTCSSFHTLANRSAQ